ncbi:MAG TPA: GntR family transcriptional regulator [Candidatus Limnocylindria bacterium]
MSLPPRLERPDVQSVEEVVTNALREAILSGELRPGDRLLQEQLAEQLRVSRIPLRDALRRLEAEGLVRIGPHRGAEVATLSADDVKEIYAIRIALEPELARTAIAALRPEDIEKLVEMSKHMDDRLDEPGAGGRARRAFYAELYAHARRPRTHSLIFRLRDDVQRYHVIHDQGEARQSHADLRECIRTQDGARAAKLLRDHLQRARDDLLEEMQREHKA